MYVRTYLRTYSKNHIHNFLPFAHFPANAS